MEDENYCGDRRREFTKLLKGTLIIITERKETVNHALHAQMISSDLQFPTSPTFLISILINVLFPSADGVHSRTKGTTENIWKKYHIKHTYCYLCNSFGGILQLA